jgi:hypothetical protein
VTTCKNEITKYEEAWAAVRAFDAKMGATAMCASGTKHAFSKKADMGEIAQMRGLLAEMGGLSAQAGAGCHT